MAVKYVNSGAGGSNDGSDWTNAWTSLASATGVAAGNDVYVHNTHSQDPGGDVTYNFSNGTTSNPVRVICVDKDNSNALSTGASIVQGTAGRSIRFDGYIYVYGMTFGSTSQFNPQGGDKLSVFENCTFTIVGSGSEFFLGGSSDGATAKWRDCSFTATTNTNILFMMPNNTFTYAELINCSFTLPSSHVSILRGGTASHLLMYGCDFGAATNIVTIASRQTGMMRLVQCSFGTFTNYTTGSMNSQGDFSSVEFLDCGSGTISTTPLSLNTKVSYRGAITTKTSVYRTGGADDGEQANAYSWEIVSNANTKDAYFSYNSPWMSRLVTGGSSTTFTIFVAGGATLQDDEIWIELLGPDDAVSATHRGYYATTRRATLGTAADLTTDGDSTWNGTGVGTMQKMSITYTPTLTGIVRVRVCLAKASTTVYVDPQIVVS